MGTVTITAIPVPDRIPGDGMHMRGGASRKASKRNAQRGGDNGD